MKPSFHYYDGGLLICRNCGMMVSDEDGEPCPDLAARCRAGTCRDMPPSKDLLPTGIRGCYVSRRSIAEIEADLERHP